LLLVVLTGFRKPQVSVQSESPAAMNFPHDHSGQAFLLLHHSFSPTLPSHYEVGQNRTFKTTVSLFSLAE
jgi:hypothetical protein